jgi:hypothetical protein
MFNYVPIKHRQMSSVSNGGKFKLYTVRNGLIFPTPTQPRILFERAIQGDSRVIMSLTKFVMQPTMHVSHTFLVLVFLIVLHNDFD